jgi:hypothetical protein
MPPDHRKKAAPEMALAGVLEKFPKSKAKIRHLFQENSSFQSLCEDYRDCLAAWQHWRQAISEEAPALCQSYAKLLRELDQEIRDYLEHEEASGPNL